MKKNRDRGKTTLLCEKESFLNAREFSHTLLFAFVCSSEREREREKKKNEEDALHPSEKRSSSRRSPLFSSS